MPREGTFYADLMQGHDAERAWHTFLKKRHPDAVLMQDEVGRFTAAPVDVYIPGGMSYEVKYDALASTTGNLAVELESRDAHTGITTTPADVWVHFTHDDVFIFWVTDLREIVKSCRTVRGGDAKTSVLALLPIPVARERACKTLPYPL